MRQLTKLNTRLLALGVLLSGLLYATLGLAATIDNVRVWPAPDHTRLVFDVSERVQHKIFVLDNPSRLVIDIKQTKNKTNLKALAKKLPANLVQRVRHAPRNGSDLRVVLDLHGKIKPRSFVLAPNETYGDRLVVDLYPKVAKPAKPTVAKKLPKKRDIVIAIDAGHGGEDPGAIGPKGVREKDVVLSLAKELNNLFAGEKGFKPVMIRGGDYYVGLRKRTKHARTKSADFMVSIHADAFSSPKAHGASVYALSDRGASSETARWLAKSENRADLIGGEGGVSLDDKDNVLAGVLLDLSMTATMRSSVGVAKEVLGEMGKVTRLHKKKVEQAGFVVLKSPDVPSILVETGFISNPAEARRLKTKSHQRKLAKAMFKGIQRYFNQNPPPGTYLAWRNHQRQREYVIARGDTLSAIAYRNGVSTRDLKRANRLKTDRLKIGQILVIPTS